MATKTTFPLATKIWFLTAIGLPLALVGLAKLNVVSEGIGDIADVFFMLSTLGFVGYFLIPAKKRLSFSIALTSALIFIVAMLWIPPGSGEYISAYILIISFIFTISSGGKFLTVISSARY